LSSRKLISRAIRLAIFSIAAAAHLHAAENDMAIEEIEVIGITPGSAQGVVVNRIPFAVQQGTAEDLQRNQSLDVSEFLNSRLASFNINSAQNNPLQPDVQFRGFTASPLLGLPQGLAVYQDGVRLNEPLGDSVNWDLLPRSAVHSMDVLSGANPVFGLNSLGGALAITMKNGFNFEGTQVEASSGSWGRDQVSIETGKNDGELGYYLNFSHFDEDGWRDLSESDATNFYGSISLRNDDISTLDIIYQHGESELIGNGALPAGLLAIDRSSVFTAPDITENDMDMINVDASHFLTEGIQLSGNIFWRQNKTHSLNGDGSEFELCEYSGGARSLFEEADDIEDALEDELGIELDDICEGEVDSITSLAELESLIESQATIAGLDPEDFELENIIDDLTGTGILSDEAINNISNRKQESQGFNSQVVFNENFFGFNNHLIVGVSYFKGESVFESVLELAELDPVTRSTSGLGTGTFYEEAETDIFTDLESSSWFFTNTWDVSDKMSLILSGRYNDTDVTLRDRSGQRPELNGDHNFTRFNPALGFTYDASDQVNIYGVYSESNRVPTPIELACNEGVFKLAQEFSELAGENPDDIDFECRLPNAFLADPPLNQVITHNFELGLRGQWHDVEYQVGLYNARNEDDILFQTTGRSTGLFANVDETARRGLETSFNGTRNALSWYASYSYMEATFEDDFNVLSPNHPNADQQGELAVQSGDRLPGLPEHIFKLGGDYNVGSRLSVGAELIYNSDQVMRGDESNDLDKVNGYALVNLRASYSMNQNFIVFARVTNLFDEDYENFGLLGEEPFEVLPYLADDRPLFLGVGAPRGAWVGLRYRF